MHMPPNDKPRSIEVRRDDDGYPYFTEGEQAYSAEEVADMLNTLRSAGGRQLPVCEAHRSGELEWPDLVGGCAPCRIACLAAQESLLEEWQQRAARAEDTIAEIQRPLDAQMARLA